MKGKILNSSFFSRAAPVVARDLLGKYIVRKIGNKKIVSMITETESYHGDDDLASHARHGKTKRTEVMYGPPGRFYVYLIYGMYSMLNIVTGKKNFPSAVLVRSVVDAVGPGRLTRFFNINKNINILEAAPKNGLWFEDRGVKVNKNEILTTPRVGVDYAGPLWKEKEWRFVYRIPEVYSKNMAKKRNEMKNETSS